MSKSKQQMKGMIAILAAVGSMAPAMVSGAQQESITLRWAIWEEDSISYWNAIAEAYELEHENIQIELVNLDSVDYMTGLLSQLEQGGLDLITVKDTPGYASLLEQEVLLELDSLIEESEVDLAQYAGVTDGLRTDGALYELPFRNDFWFLYYNKDLFDAAGVAYPTNDMTFAEYEQLVEDLTEGLKKAESKLPAETSDTGEEEDHSVYAVYYQDWRSTVQLFGILDGEHTILDEDYSFLQPYYEMVLRQQEAGSCMSFEQIEEQGIRYSEVFSEGRCAMMNTGSWYLSTLLSGLESGEYQRELCGNWGIVQYPHEEDGEGGASVSTITGLGIAADSKQQEEAFAFLEYACGAEGARILAESGNFPAAMTEDVSAILTGKEGFPKDEESQAALAVKRLYPEIAYVEHAAQIDAALNEAHKKIMTGTVSIEEGIEEMNRRCAEISG